MNKELMLQPGELQTREGNAFEMKPRSLDEAMKFAEIMANSDLVPAGYKGKPGNILVACQMGHELGMTPMRALRSICVVNGRATLWGDDMLAMVLASPVCEYVDESESTETEGICKVKRKGGPEHVSRFTLEDAKRAGLLGKQGPWTAHTGRMLKLRARGFALRDKFADVLAGLVTTEEAMDVPSDAPKTEVANEQPPTLKDKLKAKLIETEGAAPTRPASSESEGSAVDQQLPPSDAPSSAEPPEVEAWRAKIRTAHDSKTVNALWRTVPEEFKQDCYSTYTDKLKSLKGR